MKGIVRISILVALMLLLVLPCSAVVANADELLFAGGSGTAEDPYLISDQYQLDNIRLFPDAYFVLTNDIVFRDSDYTAGGKFYNYKGSFYHELEDVGETAEDFGWISIPEFNGVLDGAGYAIRNLKFSHADKNQSCDYGLFSKNKGTVRNLGIEDCYYFAHSFQSVYLGGICGINHGTIENCYVTGMLTVDYAFCLCGGICGFNAGQILKCINLADVFAVQGNPVSAGIASYNEGTIADCVNYGRVHHDVVGHSAGICNNNVGTVRNTFAYGVLTGGRSDFPENAAFLGYSSGIVENCYCLKNGADFTHHEETVNHDITLLKVDNIDSMTYGELDMENVWAIDADSNIPYLKNNPFHSRCEMDFENLFARTNDLVAEGYTYKSIRLTWKKTPDAAGYVIYRKQGDTMACVAGADTLEYIDTDGIEANTTTRYEYSICPYFENDGYRYTGQAFSFSASKVIDTMSSGQAANTAHPIVYDFSIASNEVYKPGVLKIKLHAKDSDGLGAIVMYIKEAGENIHNENQIIYMLGGEKEMNRIINIPLPSHLEYAKYKIDRVMIYDMHENYAFFNGSYFDETGFRLKEEFDIEFKGVLSNSNLIAQLEVMEEGKTAQIIVDEASKGKMVKKVLDAIRGKDKTIVIYAKDDGSIQWVINGKQIVRNTKDLDLRVDMIRQNGAAFGAKKDVLTLKFANNGLLPMDVDIRVKSEYILTMYAQQQSMYLYFDQNGVLTVEDEDCDVIEEQSTGWCYFDINHNSTYHLSGEKLKNPDEAIKDNQGVTRLAGDNRLITSYLVADMLKEQMGVEKFNSVIVASGGTFADALPGSYLSAVKNAPILLTLAKDKFINQTADYIKANLKDGGTVYILGGESAVPASMEKALAGYNVQRVAGKDRFGTNLEILKTAGVKAGDEVLVCEAKGYADSLSASATGKPVLLVYKKLTAAQKEYLATLPGCKFTVVGGTSVIPENLAKEIEAYGAVTRLAGKDRLETSTMVAEKYFGSATTAVVAYGWDFPDGLCGGSLAYAMKAPLILTHSKEKLFKFTADYTVAAGLNAGYVLGGDGLVSDAATKAIFNCNEITILK